MLASVASICRKRLKQISPGWRHYFKKLLNCLASRHKCGDTPPPKQINSFLCFMDDSPPLFSIFNQGFCFWRYVFWKFSVVKSTKTNKIEKSQNFRNHKTGKKKKKKKKKTLCHKGFCFWRIFRHLATKKNLESFSFFGRKLEKNGNFFFQIIAKLSNSQN